MSSRDESRAAANLATVTRYADAWRAGDLAALIASYHDDFTLHYSGTSSLAGNHVGKAAALKALAEVTRRTNRKLLAIVDVMAGPHRATVIAHERFEKNGHTAELDRVLVYRIDDGKLAECWVYDADQTLVDEFLAD